MPATTDVEAERTSGALDRRVRALLGDSNYDLAWLSSYRFHQRVVPSFQVGRVFLAGDAAHLMAPFGARGLNSGVEDAINLAWRLALVTSGDAPSSLLESYGRERRAAAMTNLRITAGTGRFMAPPTPLHRAHRWALLRASTHSKWARQQVNDVRFTEPATYARGEHPLVGRLAPVCPAEMRPGQLTALVAGDPQVGRAVAQALADQPVQIAAAAPGSAPASNLDDDHVVLLRPDGYVAAVVKPEGLAAAVSATLRGEL